MDISPQSCVFLEIMPHYSTPFFPLQLQNSYKSPENSTSAVYFFPAPQYNQRAFPLPQGFMCAFIKF